jgi:hypothetical protein
LHFLIPESWKLTSLRQTMLGWPTSINWRTVKIRAFPKTEKSMDAGASMVEARHPPTQFVATLNGYIQSSQ